MSKILNNSVQCTSCGDILESKHYHDFKRCGCDNNVELSGGLTIVKLNAVNFDLVKSLIEFDSEDNYL